MLHSTLKAKIHRATVTETDLDYEGSITIDRDLLEQSGISEYERVQVVNVTNGYRLETYTIAGDEGQVCLNGAAARRAEVGDHVIVIAYSFSEDDETVDPTILLVDKKNDVIERR